MMIAGRHSLGWLLALGLGLTACTGELAPRNTIQHGVIAKEDLTGADGKAVFYYLQTVVDVPYATGFTFTGEQSLMEKIRWDIQEKVLYARRAYEWVRGSEVGSGEQGSAPGKVMGAPIAGFAIEKHFDIIRDYNAATGEEINKIVENDSDRHWYERKFIRVDWSKNLVPSFEFLVHFDDDAVSPLRQEAVPYYASNPDDPDALRIRRPDATAEDPRPSASYLEVTSKLLVTPELTTETYVDGKYRLPACYLAEDNGPEFASTDCSPQEVKVRHAFLRATARDYDALAYDDRWMERFGYFSTERRSYDPQYQETETGRVRLINRWNLWRRVLAESSCSLKDHYKPGPDARAAADAARRAADAACAALEGEGSTCASVQGRCTLPPEQREGVRPIVYYLSAGFPAELRKAAEEAVASWNDALGTTAARLLYPKDNPADAKLLAARKAELGTVFELRDNDCSELRVNELLAAHPELGARVVAAAGLAAGATPPFTLADKALTLACAALESATAGLPAGERFEWQRIGDLRYSMLYWVGLPTRAGLLGYGPSSADPETGETIQATVFIYGAVHDSYTARSTDIVGLLGCADEKCIQNYAQGVPIADWVAQAKSGTSKARTSFSDEEIATMAKAMNTSWLKAAAKELPPLDFSSLESLRVSRRARATALASSKLLGQNGKTSSARLKPLQGTALEEMAKNQYLAGIGRPATSPFPALAGAPSFAELAGPGLLAERRRVRRLLAKRKLELASFWDNAILGLALRYKETGKPRAEIFKDLRARLFKGVAEHEVGHTLGLRHNFAASYDAMNYSPSYWKLRTLDAAGKALPRYKSPFSELELKGNAKDPAAREGLGSYQYASVMDYGAKFNSDIAGLGYWDQAAIKFGYGQLVEVFEKTGASAEDRYLLANVQTSMRWGEPLLFTLTCDGKSYRSVHYTEYPRLLGGAANLGRGNRIDVPLRKLTTQKLDKVVPGCAVYADGFGASDVPVDDRGRFEVPYRFCSDEYEGASPECNAFDAGADPYEQAQTIIDSYHAYYLFHNLKLNRLGFSLWGYLDTLSSRTFDPLRSSMQFYLLIRGELTLDPRNAKFLGDAELEAFYKADNGYGPWTVAVDRSLNLLLDVLATPEPGDYWIDLDNRYGTIPYVDTATGKELPPDLNLGVPSAKYGATSWDFDSGYFWYDKMSNVGVYHDKFLALWALTDPDTWFMGRDTATDQRQYAINYYRLYPDLVTRYVQGLMAEDWSATGHFAANKNLIKRDFTVGGAPPAGALPVDPKLGFSLQFWGALLGVSLIPATYDTAFLDSCRVWVKGSVEEITPSDTPTCIADPIGGKSYCAMTRKNAAGVQTGVGAAMIARAQTLKDLYTADPSEENRLYLVQYIDSLELMRSITRTFGSTPL